MSNRPARPRPSTPVGQTYEHGAPDILAASRSIARPTHRHESQNLPLAKRFAFAVVLLSGSLLLSLFLLETFVRSGLDVYQCDDHLGWTFKRGGFGAKISRVGEFMHVHKFNSYGFRDTGWDPLKGEDIFRILLLGDSFAAGLQVSNDALFSTIIEKSMNATVGDKPKIEIVNGAIDGYGTTQQLLLFREIAEQLEPDAVMLQVFIGNDIADNWPGSGSWLHWLARKCGRPYFKPDQNQIVLMNKGMPVRRPMSAFEGALTKLELYSVLFPSPAPPQDVRPDFELSTMWEHSYRDQTERAWQHFTRVLSEFAQVVSDQGLPFLVLLIPSMPDAGEGLSDKTRLHYYNALTHFLRTKNVAYIDTLPALRKVSRAESHPAYFEGDGHLKELGHRLVAGVVHDWFTLRCVHLEARGNNFAFEGPASCRELGVAGTSKPAMSRVTGR